MIECLCEWLIKPDSGVKWIFPVNSNEASFPPSVLPQINLPKCCVTSTMKIRTLLSCEFDVWGIHQQVRRSEFIFCWWLIKMWTTELKLNECNDLDFSFNACASIHLTCASTLFSSPFLILRFFNTCHMYYLTLCRWHCGVGDSFHFNEVSGVEFIFVHGVTCCQDGAGRAAQINPSVGDVFILYSLVRVNCMYVHQRSCSPLVQACYSPHQRAVMSSDKAKQMWASEWVGRTLW